MAEEGIGKIPESFMRSRILSYSVEALVAFGRQRGVPYVEGESKEDYVDRLFEENPGAAYELYTATEIRKTVSEGLLIERSQESGEAVEGLGRDEIILSLLEERRRQILQDVQLLMSQERAKTFRRYILREGSVDADLAPLTDPSTPDFENLRNVVESRLSLPGKMATLERVLLRDESYLFFIKYVDKIRYAEEMDGRHWDTLIRRVIAVHHPPSGTLEVGTPDANREARTVSILSAFLAGSEDAFRPWAISTANLLSSISDPGWSSEALGSGKVGVSYVDFTNIDLQGRPQKISLLGDDVLLTMRSLSSGGLDLSRVGSLHKVRLVFRGRKIDLFPEEGKFIFLAYMDEKQRMAFYDWISAMGWA